jgi:cellobiose phosphorylase
VLSGAADPSRARQAIEAVYERLVRTEDRLVLLFAPPFDDGSLNPGYVSGYLPGVRENGGQYTHAAVWVIQATATLGFGRRAMELTQMINPILHTQNRQGLERYQVEPYVLAGDVYSIEPHIGRGGWTWYTGSAGWFYRVILESILGVRRVGDRLEFNPCVPPEWSHYEVTLRFGTATYRIRVENPNGTESGVVMIWLDNQMQPARSVALFDDGRTHEIRVVLGQA